VKNYVSMLFAKLGMKQHTQAAAYAARALGGCKLELSQNMRIIDRKPPQISAACPTDTGPSASAGQGRPRARCGLRCPVLSSPSCETVVRDRGGDLPRRSFPIAGGPPA
jgi:hypothetical protein